MFLPPPARGSLERRNMEGAYLRYLLQMSAAEEFMAGTANGEGRKEKIVWVPIKEKVYWDRCC